MTPPLVLALKQTSNIKTSGSPSKVDDDFYASLAQNLSMDLPKESPVEETKARTTSAEDDFYASLQREISHELPPNDAAASPSSTTKVDETIDLQSKCAFDLTVKTDTGFDSDSQATSL